MSSGHNLSQADGTSLEGEMPANTGCFKNYEHAMPNKVPQNTDPPLVRFTNLSTWCVHKLIDCYYKKIYYNTYLQLFAKI